MPVTYLKIVRTFAHPVWGPIIPSQERLYVCWQAGLFSDPRTSAPAHFPPMRPALPGELQGQGLLLSRPVSLHGFCPVDLSGKSTRHRSLSAGSKQQALPHGYPLSGVEEHSGQRQQSSRLAHLRRLGPCTDTCCPQTLSGRRLRGGTRPDGLCSGRHHHRPVPVRLSLGTVPTDQGGDQAAYPARSSRQHPDLHLHFRRQAARRQRSGRLGSGSRRVLRHGPWLSRLLSALRADKSPNLLCHPGQKEFVLPPALFRAGGPEHWPALRPDDRSDQPRVGKILSREAAAYQISRCRDGQNSGISQQQLYPAGPDYHPTLPQPVEGGAVLQVDQAEPADQGILWHQRERREDPNLDCGNRVPAG